MRALLIVGAAFFAASCTHGGARMDDRIHLIGRFDTSDPVHPRFDASASTITARFFGTGIGVALTGGADNWFTAVVDGVPRAAFAVNGSGTYPLVEGLPSDEHSLVLFKRTEPIFGAVRFDGFFVTGGTLLPNEPEVTRRIELIGDSITCGFGNEGVGPGCKFSPDTENAYLAYGALVARTLAAEQTVVAWSGRGVYRNADGTTKDTMPVLWTRTLATVAGSVWPFRGAHPDVVVVNLGTNDFAQGDPGTRFIGAYEAFVRDIRVRYPRAFIFVVLGPMLAGTQKTTARSYLGSVVSDRIREGDTKIAFVEMPEQDTALDGVGCDYHPSIKTHEKMAAALTAVIKRELGW